MAATPALFPLMAVKVRPTAGFVAGLPKLMSLVFPSLCRRCHTSLALHTTQRPEPKHYTPTPRGPTYFTPKLLNPFALPFIPKPALPTKITPVTPVTPTKPIPAPRKIKSTQASPPSPPTTVATQQTPTPRKVETLHPQHTTYTSFPKPHPIDVPPSPECKAVIARYSRGTPVVQAAMVGWACHMCDLEFASEDELFEHSGTESHRVQMDLQRKFIHVCELCDIECPGLDCFLAHVGGKKHCRLEGESRL